MPVIASNQFAGIAYPGGVTAPPMFQTAIAKSDTDDQPFVLRGIYVGVTGDVKVTALGDSVVGGAVSDTPQTYKAVPAGTTLVGFFTRIWSTGTSATNMIGLR